ncbi:zinc finger protein 558-like isoform X2 [Ochlerotatus camptorhynchus]|uniref:zinc finger protein 558-like isoform X2 n=1 Tax=Ochlerotatus camptorhynchus TaxID=644619 RepID=UPI0031D9E42F
MSTEYSKVLENDGLPDIVCATCEKDLKSALGLKQKCLESDVKLRSIIKTENLLKTIYDAPVISYKILYEEVIEHTPPEIETTYIVESQPTLIEEPNTAEVDQSKPTQIRDLLPTKTEQPEHTKIEEPQVSQVEDLKLFQIEESEPTRISEPDFAPIEHPLKQVEQTEVNQTQNKEDGKEGNQSFRCCGCEQIFQAKTKLLQHSKEAHERQRTSNSEKPFECSVCYKRYTTERGYKLHRKSVYQLKNHQCPSCGKRFSNRRVLDNHERTHTTLKPFPCSSCSKSFRSKSNLLSHLKLHSAIQERKKHVCDICDKGFSRKSYLKYHKNLLHSEETPFLCSFCPSKFKANANLRLHLRTHTQERPYSCDLCDKTFMYPTDKKRHVLQHSGMKPFKCQDCDKGFTRKTLLQKHRTNCHEDVPTGQANQDDEVLKKTTILTICTLDQHIAMLEAFYFHKNKTIITDYQESPSRRISVKK